MNTYLHIFNQLQKQYNDTHLATQHAHWIMQELELISDPAQKKDLCQQMLARIIQNNEPILYVLGWTTFCSNSISIEPPTLIPRPETEEWVANLIAQLTPFNDTSLAILDIGTGSGCIAIALAQAFKKAHVYAVDISKTALLLAQKNALKNNVLNITFLESNLFETVDPTITFDLIVSNPPYISTDEWESVDQSVKKWEDYGALVAPDQGTEIIKKIVQTAPSFLHKKSILTEQNIPNLWIEFGYQQGETVQNIMQAAGFKQVTIHKDYAGNDRVATGIKK